MKMKCSILSDLFSDEVSRPHLESDLSSEQVTTETNGFQTRSHVLLDVWTWPLGSEPFACGFSTIPGSVSNSSSSTCLNLCLGSHTACLLSYYLHVWTLGPGPSLHCEDNGDTISLKEPNPELMMKEESRPKVQWACSLRP